MMKRLTATATAALAAAATAGAAGEPSVLADAQIRDLHVTSGILVSAKSVDLRGVWLNEHVACSTTRKLRVRVEVNRIPASGAPLRRVRQGTFTVGNCAEGGPNTGFTLSASSLGFACPNGTWKPARYDFVTSTIQIRTGLRALADLSWNKPGGC